VIQLTARGLRGDADADTLRAEFDANHALRLPALLHPELIERLLPRLESGTWEHRHHAGISRDVTLNDPVAQHLMHFLLGAPDCLEAMRRITGCEQIRAFHGRFYRFLPLPGHRHTWHDDRGTEGQDRRIGISINLSFRPYEGGVFQLRRARSRRRLCELPNVQPGHAIVFRISPELQHRVTPVQGDEPKTAFAGWFLADGSDHLTAIKSRERFAGQS
jgi:hypothetical protein